MYEQCCAFNKIAVTNEFELKDLLHSPTWPLLHGDHGGAWGTG